MFRGAGSEGEGVGAVDVSVRGRWMFRGTTHEGERLLARYVSVHGLPSLFPYIYNNVYVGWMFLRKRGICSHQKSLAK